MVLYVGEAVRIRVSALDPETGNPLDPPPTSAKVDFWAPGRNPIRDASVRGTPDVPNVAMAYRTATTDYVVFQPTSGNPWVAGKWTYRVTVVGNSYSNWEYATFVLKP